MHVYIHSPFANTCTHRFVWSGLGTVVPWKAFPIKGSSLPSRHQKHGADQGRPEGRNGGAGHVSRKKEEPLPGTTKNGSITSYRKKFQMEDDKLKGQIISAHL